MKRVFGIFVCFRFPPSFPLTEHTLSYTWTQPEDLPTIPVPSTRFSEISRAAEPPLLRPSPPVPFNFVLNFYFSISITPFFPAVTFSFLRRGWIVLPAVWSRYFCFCVSLRLFTFIAHESMPLLFSFHFYSIHFFFSAFAYDFTWLILYFFFQMPYLATEYFLFEITLLIFVILTWVLLDFFYMVC